MKKKRIRFAENATFPHVFQPQMHPPEDHQLKGKWHSAFFKNDHPIVLELGCGRGEYTVNLAEKYPEKNYIGIDWKGARLWRGAKTSFENKMSNVAFLRIQIQSILRFFAAEEVSEIWITFPDPQPQQSRERKRLTSPRFLDMYSQILIGGGNIHLKTDNRPLYEYTRSIISEKKLITQYATDDLYASDSEDEILAIKTTYEKIFLSQGAKICYIRFSLT